MALLGNVLFKRLFKMKPARLDSPSYRGIAKYSYAYIKRIFRWIKKHTLIEENYLNNVSEIEQLTRLNINLTIRCDDYFFIVFITTVKQAVRDVHKGFLQLNLKVPKGEGRIKVNFNGLNKTIVLFGQSWKIMVSHVKTTFNNILSVKTQYGDHFNIPA